MLGGVSTSGRFHMSKRQLDCLPWTASGDLVAAATVTQLLHIAVIVGFSFHFHIIIQSKAQSTHIVVNLLETFGLIVYLSGQSPCQRCKPRPILLQSLAA